MFRFKRALEIVSDHTMLYSMYEYMIRITAFLRKKKHRLGDLSFLSRVFFVRVLRVAVRSLYISLLFTLGYPVLIL
jgi:hypothetical protein